MAKVNLTKQHLRDIEKVVKILKLQAKDLSGVAKKEMRELAVSVEDILVRHDNRLEKEY